MGTGSAVARVTEAGGYYIHWGVVQISLANLLVVIAMVAVFILALVLPFPGSGDRRRRR